MSKKAIYTYQIDGLFHTVNYYLSETPIDINNLPIPKATGITGTSFTDTTLDVNKKYYARLGSVRGASEKISNEFIVSTFEYWTPANSNIEKTYWFDAKDAVMNGASIQSIPSKVNSYSANATSATIQDEMIRLNTVNSAIKSADLKDFLVSKRKFFIFFVVKTVVISGSPSLFIHWLPGSTKFNALLLYASANNSLNTAYRRYDWNNNTIVTTPSAFNTEHSLVLVQFDTVLDKLTVHINGELKTSTTCGTTALLSSITVNDLELAACSAGSDLLYNDMIGGNTDILNQTDIDKYFGWAAHKYGVSQKLPSAHPYKASAPTI